MCAACGQMDHILIIGELQSTGELFNDNSAKVLEKKS
jgi:hypothetical protein